MADSTSTDRWEDPPVRHQRAAKRPADFDYLGVAEAVFRRQGRWARIWAGASPEGASVRRWFAARGFSVATRRDDPETEMQLWVRWPQEAPQKRSAALRRRLAKSTSGALPALRWCNPPARTPGNTPYRGIARELQRKPGEWALVDTVTAAQANLLRQGLRRAGCEVTTRTTGTNKRGVWARWPKSKP